MTFVADLSYGWPTLTGEILHNLGVFGVIGYAGCDDAGKNVSKQRLADWLAHGLQVALVIENGERDLDNGTTVGNAQASSILGAAEQLGYDWEHSVLFTGADFNEGVGDYPKTLAAFQAFAHHIPIPGYYGDSDSIDYLAAHGFPHAIYWQSSSASYSPKHPTENAWLQQRYGDARAHGHALDVNDILKTPLPFMGANMSAPSAKDIANEVWKHIIYAQGTDPKRPAHSTAFWLENPNELLAEVVKQLDTLTAKIEALAPQAHGTFTITGTGTVDPS